MAQKFTKRFFLNTLLYILCSSSLFSQKHDHLNMVMNFKDSIVSIEAKYQSASKVDRSSVYFLLNPGFKLDTIISKGLASYNITQKKGIPLPFYQLKFDENLDNKLTVVFKYKINLSKQNHMKSNWIELNADKLWFPNLDAINNKFTYKVTAINFPNSYKLLTHADAKITRRKNKIIITKTRPWYEVLMLAGYNMKEWTFNKNITLFGSEKINDSIFNSIGSKVQKSIQKLNGYFGKSDPIASFKVVLRNTNRKELGFQFNRRNMIITGTDFNDLGNLSHEIAHYWWSRANFIAEPWMNESFANFSMYQVLKEFDSKNYNRIIESTKKLTEKAIPVSTATLFAKDSYISYYHKGALHLLSLENKIGSKLMKQLLSTCVKKNINTTEAFLRELEKLTNKEDREFFENLLKS